MIKITELDITDRKKVEEELLNEKQFTEAAINAQRDTFFVFEPSTGKAIRWNKAFSEISGYTDKEIANLKAPESYYSELDLISSAKAIEKIGNKGTAILEMNLITKDGQSIPFEYLGTNINDEDGNLKYIVSVGRDIRERKEAKNKLKKTEKYLSNIFSSIQDGICVLDKDYNIMSYNPKIEEWYSHSQPIMGKKCFQAFRNRIDPCEDCECRDILKSGDHFCESEIYKEINGKIDQIFDVYTFPLYDQETGDINGIIKYIRDITGKKKEEQKLKESEKRLKDERDNLLNMLNSMEDGVYIINQYYEIEFVNPSLKKAFGQIANSKCYEYFQNRSEPCPWCKTQEKTTQGSIRWEWDSPITKKFYEITATPIKRVDGNFSKLVIFHDITKRKKAGNKLKKAREHADIYLNLAGVILVALNKDGIITLLNKKGYKILEYEEGELEGQNWIEKCLPEKIKDETYKYLTGLMNGELKYFEYAEGDIITKNGKNKTIAWHNTVLYDKNGNISETLSSGEDITERKKAEKELTKLSKLKSELLTRTSHELKTPAMHIKGYADLLLHKYKKNLGFEELNIINHIKKGCLRLETLIYDILHKAELDFGHGELRKVQNDLSSFLELSVKELKSFAALRGHSIILNIRDSIIVSFDEDQIRHVINNLLTNAIKYTPLNGIIEISSTIDDDFITIAVRDNGIGVTDKEKERLFSQFGKIERYGQGYDIITEGSGLGLYISKKIIDLHGGEIWVESKGKNKGSTFNFSLPRM